MKKETRLKTKLARDLLWILVSICFGIILIHSDLINNLLVSTEHNAYLGSFIAGIFFTSIFTIAPASIALVKIAQISSPLHVAIIGAFGAMIGDYILFQFIRDSFAKDISDYLALSPSKRMHKILSLKLLRWFRPIVGAAVIISPLPDELGLTLLGFSRMPTIVMLPLTFFLNFLGILLLYFATNAFI